MMKKPTFSGRIYQTSKIRDHMVASEPSVHSSKNPLRFEPFLASRNPLEEHAGRG
jgi:hypothetical protein